jgi:hypothetical protein
VIRKLLIKLVILAFFLSPFASAQPPRPGPGANPEGPRGVPEVPQGRPGQAGPGNNLAPPQLDAEPAVTRQQALDIARDRFQGRVLSVRMVDSDWRIRVDQNGTVFNVFVDGRTGEVSRAVK